MHAYTGGAYFDVSGCHGLESVNIHLHAAALGGAGAAGCDEGCEVFLGKCVGKALHDFGLHDVKRGGVVAEHGNRRAFGFAQGRAGVFLEFADANGEGGEQGLHDGLVFGDEISAYFEANWLMWQLRVACLPGCFLAMNLWVILAFRRHRICAERYLFSSVKR